MKIPTTAYPKYALNKQGNRGFALIATITVMLLLIMIALSMLSLSTITVRSSQQGSSIKTARANARLALMQALGELQKYAGPDQRVTASSSILDSAEQKNWLGVWSNKKKDTLPVWLVSGNGNVTGKALDELETYPAGYVQPEGALPSSFKIFPSAGTMDAVSVPIVDISRDSKKPGRYAWWISDEGVKARADVEAPEGTPDSDHERLAQLFLSRAVDFTEVAVDLQPLSTADPDQIINKDALVSFNTMDVALADTGVSKKYAHDLTTGGYGLPVDVVEGGMKTDLSVLFDSSQKNDSALLIAYFGAVPHAIRTGNKQHLLPDIETPDTFFLSPELREGKPNLLAGPNWGILYNYGRLWDQVSDGKISKAKPSPRPEADVRTNQWAPYSGHSLGRWRTDTQHINSSVAPVIAFVQMGFRISAKSGVIVPNTNPPAQGYQLQLQMKPVIGLWNPYNVKIRATSYKINWGLYPFIRIAATSYRDRITPTQVPPFKFKGKQAVRAEIFMRDQWKDGSGVSSATGWGTNFNMEIGSEDFEPGELRLFSVTGKQELEQDDDKRNGLVSGWNEDGAFHFDLVYSKADDNGGGYEPAGEPIILPNGTDVWFGGAFLEDTLHPQAREFWGSIIEDGTSASWLTVGGGNQLQTMTDLWHSPTSAERDNLEYQVPEPIISPYARTGGNDNGGQTYPTPVELLGATPHHVGTWRFFTRTTTQAVGAENGGGSQRIRGFVDSNPRFISANPSWDGSRFKNGSEEGLHFISPMIGGTYEDKPANYAGYDDGPGGRGKIAEGQDEGPTTPEVNNDGGRYQGFGGLSTSSSGQNHVTVFDVPRAPLVSLGQFQHAQLSRYAHEPALPFGNSYASYRIPLDQTVVQDAAGITGFRMLDTSYSLNKALWDGYFFSTIGVDYKSSNSSVDLDTHYPVSGLASGEVTLPNPRYRYIPHDSNTKISEIVGRSDRQGPNAISSHIAIDGAFNVNSTSVAAWKAILASMANFEFPVLSQDGTSTSWEKNDAIRFPRFGHVMQADGWESTSDGEDPSFWRGYRQISAAELDSLATNIVAQIKARGPFRSFADFVNRDPDSDNEAHQRKGALQVALDATINQVTTGDVADAAEMPRSPIYSQAMDNESQAVGHAGYMMQSDVLQALAPVLQVRSDYFRIRAVGQATDGSGKVLATAICEAYVQRTAKYVDDSDEPHLAEDELLSVTNKNFGRRFRIVSFRWVGKAELEEA